MIFIRLIFGTNVRKCSYSFYNGKIDNQTMADYVIEKIFLYEWFEEDMEVILEDYRKITDKIKNGKAHELSESDGNYLSTCTKGAGGGKDWRDQPFSNVKAKQRAWELKSSYMTYLINHKIFNQSEQESVVSTAKVKKSPSRTSFQRKLCNIKERLSLSFIKNLRLIQKRKEKNSTLIRKMLGLTGDLDKNTGIPKSKFEP